MADLCYYWVAADFVEFAFKPTLLLIYWALFHAILSAVTQ